MTKIQIMLDEMFYRNCALDNCKTKKDRQKLEERFSREDEVNKISDAIIEAGRLSRPRGFFNW